MLATLAGCLLSLGNVPAKAGPTIRLVVRATTPISSVGPGQPTTAGSPGLPVAPAFPRREPVRIATSPGDPGFCQVDPGAPLRVLRRKGVYSLVEPLGGNPPIRGWIQSSALGLRVLRNAPLFPEPGGRPMGRVRGGMLVHVVRKSGRFMLVEVSAKAHALVWMLEKDLGTDRVSATSSLHYVNGTRRIIGPGPLFASPGGRKIAQVVYPAEGRVVSRKTKAGQTWLHVNLGVPWHVKLRGWVRKKQVRRGFTVPGFGSWYVPNPPRASNRRGRYVLDKAIHGFAARDDAYPTVTLPAGTVLDVVGPGSSRWITIQVWGPGIRCKLAVLRNDGIWIQKNISPSQRVR